MTEALELNELTEAREALDAAQAKLKAQARTTIEALIRDAFEDSDITNIAWAQKSSEYNDEGMYPGIVGPVVNVNEEGRQQWVGVVVHQTDSRLPELTEALNLIGEEILSDIFGDEAYVIATRDGEAVKLVTEYAGY